jgi:putative oxidoreductase
MQSVVGLLITVGFLTRPLALRLALYAVGTVFICYPYLAMTSMQQYANIISFYKKLSIIGGLLLLAATGPGKCSLDKEW